MSQYQSRVFGQYTLLERIASGGMAEIFLAKTKGFGGFEKTLVIKRLHPHYSDDQQFVKMLVDEAKITVQLQHANIVQVFDLGRVGGQYYIAMEYVEGKDLFHVLRELHQNDFQMPLEAACYIVAEMCHGLHYSHLKRDALSGEPLQVIHRDISPQNILLSWSGEVKIGDFGIVKAAQRSTHTEAGIIKGKFYYMSPEQALGIDIDWRSDIFSTGIVLFETLTATPLYDDTEDATLMQRVQSGDVRSPCEFRDDIPPELERICMKALEADREDRYQGALEMGRDLANFVVSRGRSFTKVDLSDFLRSLFSDTRVTDPEMPEPRGIELGLDADEDVEFESQPPPLAGPQKALSKPEPARPRDVPPPIPAAARRVAEPVAVDPDPTHKQLLPPVGRVAPEPPTVEVPQYDEPPEPAIAPAAQPPAIEPSATNPDARTARLSKDEIARVNAAIQARRAKAAAPLELPDPPPSSTGEAAARPPAARRSEAGRASIRRPGRIEPVPATQKSQPIDIPLRTGRSPGLTPSRARQLQRRERWLKVALGVVGVAILAVTTAIIWVLLNPVELHGPAEELERPARVRPDKQRDPVTPPATEATRPTGSAGVAPPTAGPQRPGRVMFRTASGQAYRLYVDGEFTTPVNDAIELPAGRHTVRARLLPEGRMTAERVVEVAAGRSVTVELSL